MPFKAILDKTEPVISLDESVQPHLTGWAHSGRLSCPGCKSEFRFKPGGERRPHFFHRVRTDCKYKSDAEIEAARASLYVALKAKVEAKGGTISLEEKLPGAPEDDLIDVLIRFPNRRPIAYRIFTRALKPARMGELRKAELEQGMITLYLLTISRREWANPLDVPERQRDLIIPPYDQRLITPRTWDQYHVRSLEPPRAGSLVYIDPKEERLVLYRALRRSAKLDCKPNTYTYEGVLETKLVDVLLTVEGEFVYPSEVPLKDEWKTWAVDERERKRQLEERERERQRQAEERERESQRQFQEKERMRLEQAEAIRAERAKEYDINRLAEQARVEEERERDRAYWASLRREGDALLEGRPLPWLVANPYRLPPEDWQPRFLATASRIAIPFRYEDLVYWMRQSIGWQNTLFPTHERRVLNDFLAAAVQRGLLISFERPGGRGIAYKLAPELIFQWPVHRGSRAYAEAMATCIVCGIQTGNWSVLDPELEVCRCRMCDADLAHAVR